MYVYILIHHYICTYIHMYVYMCVCACVCICVYVEDNVLGILVDVKVHKIVYMLPKI